MKADLSLLLTAACGLLLASCSEDPTPLIEARAAELAARIDQLGIKNQELAAQTKSFEEVERQLTELEEQNRRKLQDLAGRERMARENIAKIDADMATRVSRVKEMEKEADNYAATQEPIAKHTEERLARLMEKSKSRVESAPKSTDPRAIMLERAADTIERLQQENAQLRAALGQQQPVPVTPPGQ